MNDMQSHLHTPTHASIYLGMLLSHMQNFIWRVNHMPMLQQVCCYPFANNSFATMLIALFLFYFLKQH